ncbi:S8 family serine peptidase [Spirosoma soli]|uniref:S8 family serine peptidase n=1 Tax=Spirosoma soli TaxID=1770529 RepID=A0ABW5M879_9BACT
MSKSTEPAAIQASEEYTGRYLVMMPNSNNTAKQAEAFREATGLQMMRSSDFKDSVVSSTDFEQQEAIYLEELGVAVVNAKPQQLSSLSVMADDNESYIVEPERVVRALNSSDYLKGFKDAVDVLVEKLGQGGQETTASFDKIGVEANGSTWGLQQTNVVHPNRFREFTGKGIRVAVLDTGMDLSHPDFAGRKIITASFIDGESVQDGHGHGTHCIGTACGPLNPVDPTIPRYGIAYESIIYAGKVLSNAGSGSDGGILAGINWALANKCEVISMSLGASTSQPGFSQIFENVAANVLAKGTLIVAAAGNDSNRPGFVRPVSHPANCPSIMAVGAVNKTGKVARFSNRGIHAPYGNVDIAGPGEGVFSSTKLPEKYVTWNGTSMATPHVAGIAALLAQQSKSNRGFALWKKLLSMAKPLHEPTTDVGAGLVQAPLVPIRIVFPPSQVPVSDTIPQPDQTISEAL